MAHSTTINHLVDDTFGAINRLWDIHGDDLWLYLKPEFNGNPGYRLVIARIMYPNSEILTIWAHIPQQDKSTAESIRILGNKHIIQLSELE